jgi:hypothetical protein
MDARGISNVECFSCISPYVLSTWLLWVGQSKGEAEAGMCLKELSMVQKTYNSGDSPVVTHLTTNPPVKGLSCGERTGSRVFLCLWSYVAVFGMLNFLLAEKIGVVVARRDSAWAIGT